MDQAQSSSDVAFVQVGTETSLISVGFDVRENAITEYESLIEALSRPTRSNRVVEIVGSKSKVSFNLKHLRSVHLILATGGIDE